MDAIYIYQNIILSGIDMPENKMSDENPEIEGDEIEQNSVAKGTDYELFVKAVYEALLVADGIDNVAVNHNIKLMGKSGCEHQIDVFWEFQIAGCTHKVAIECKSYNSRVSIGRVRDFYGVLTDIPNLQGIFATKLGYQSGAQKYASHYGINLKEIREKPEDADWEGRIRTINFQINVVEPNILDFRPNLSLSAQNRYQQGQQIALKFGTHDPLIFDAQNNPIETFETLRGKLPHNGKDIEFATHRFDFPSHTLKTATESIDIEAVTIDYSVRVTKIDPIKIEADKFVKAIIKDVKSGEIKFIEK
ncbi:restriction endonuclease [Acetobacter senegalensis]|uniref:restriction endonuclease n=1 Tax=Acetobacter senegalensis TaxID=446692 RepID=UPI00264B86D1|nr:restriction endonuclease [Acetobacter senegalensis]MDN7350166.1 restriction endonuclease [Acetobacter senegalensis]